MVRPKCLSIIFIIANTMQFISSQKEISRRKKAFISLCLFFMIGASFLTTISRNPSTLLILTLLLCVLIFFLIITFIFLSSIAKNRLLIDDEKIELVNTKNSTRILLSEIIRLKIKRRSSGAIREMYIWSRSGESLFINAFEDGFEQIEKLVRDRLGKDVAVQEIVEPIVLDHILFYPIFGLCVGILSILFLNMVMTADGRMLDMVNLATIIYLFFLGIFFLWKKPMLSRSAKKNATADIAFGLVLIIYSIVIFFTRR